MYKPFKVKYLGTPSIRVSADPTMALGTFKLVSTSYSAGTISVTYDELYGTKPKPADPLDVEYDGCALRCLLAIDEKNRRGDGPRIYCVQFTPVQRAAVSAHWSAELRASSSAAKQKDRNQVTLESDE